MAAPCRPAEPTDATAATRVDKQPTGAAPAHRPHRRRRCPPPLPDGRTPSMSATPAGNASPGSNGAQTANALAADSEPEVPVQLPVD